MTSTPASRLARSPQLNSPRQSLRTTVPGKHSNAERVESTARSRDDSQAVIERIRRQHQQRQAKVAANETRPSLLVTEKNAATQADESRAVQADHARAQDRRTAIARLHELSHSPERKNVFDSLVFTAFGVAAVISWMNGIWPATVVCWILAGHFGHAKPLMFHDAAHGTLFRWKLRNEVWGMFYGTLILVPLSVYRHAHASHHAYMSTEKDPELWPFTVPGTPRWLRVLLAIVEIVFGFLYTPLLMFRSLFVGRPLSTRRKWQIAGEYLLVALLWGSLLWTVNHFQVWMPFLVGYMIPVWIAGMYQTLNKYTEHLGLLGDSILSGTRMVIPQSQWGQLVSLSMQHVDYHGTHHRFARIPYYHLPSATPFVYQPSSASGPIVDAAPGADSTLAESVASPLIRTEQTSSNESSDQTDNQFDEPFGAPVFFSYPAAFWDMLTTLGNPRVGSQWLGQTRTQRLRKDPLPESPRSQV